MDNPFGTNIENAATEGLHDVKLEPALVREPPKILRASGQVMEPKVRIILEQNEGIPPTGQFFGLNGRTFMLRPGVAADVPLGLVNILNDAIMSEAMVDPMTQQVTGFRDRLRFPYRIVANIPVPETQAA